jgi:predicted nucleic acid-binding protein
MTEAISNTSPLLYLHRARVLPLLPKLFSQVIVPSAVVNELETGRRLGHAVPECRSTPWMQITAPMDTPPDWLAAEIGPGELAALALRRERGKGVLLLDDAHARRLAHSAGFEVWGTLKVLLELKAKGALTLIAPIVENLFGSGMWISPALRERILKLANEN